jgi:hypothetical protein
MSGGSEDPEPFFENRKVLFGHKVDRECVSVLVFIYRSSLV